MVMPNSSSPVLYVLCQVTEPQICLCSLLAEMTSELDLIHPEMYFIGGFTVSDCMMTNILKCATVIFDFLFKPVCVSLVIHDTYTFFTHAAGRIPGKHFNFDLLTFKLCFPLRQPFCPLHPVLFQLYFTPLSSLYLLP